MAHTPARVGIVTLGHGPYWPQFPGLREELMAKTAGLSALLSPWAAVEDGGFADSVPAVEFSLRAGPVTLLSVGLNANGAFRFIVAQGVSERGEIPATGNTNTRCRFPGGAADFVARWSAAGPTHHLALGTGHQAAVLCKVAGLLGVEMTVL